MQFATEDKNMSAVAYTTFLLIMAARNGSCTRDRFPLEGERHQQW